MANATDRFWNMTGKQMAELTDGDLRALVNVELMERGVLRVEPPVLEVIEDVEIPTRTMFTVECEDKADTYHRETFPVCWETEDEASHFLLSNAKIVRKNWDFGSDRLYVSPSAMKVVTVQVHAYQDLVNGKARLDENRAKKDRNDAATKLYTGAMKAVEAATKDLWDAYYAARETKANMERYLRTWNEYLEMTGGNREVAVKFLAKAIGAEAVREMAEWFGMTDVPFPSEAE